MTRDGCLGTARPASRPALSYQAIALSCPICRQFITLNVTEYDRRFTGHNPTQEQASAWLSGRSHDRLAARRGWPLTANGQPGQAMTRPEAGAFFIEYNSDASGRQCETHWFCIPLVADVSNIITREEWNEDHTVRRVCGWTTKLLRD